MSIVIRWTLVTVMMIAVGLFMVSPVWAQNLAVRSISSDCREVVLVDRATGMEWLGTQGDWVGDWRISELSCQGITLTKPVDENNLQAIRFSVPIVVTPMPALPQAVPK